MLLYGSLVLIFLVDDMLEFYILFELPLLRMFLMILLFGSGRVRVRAADQLFLSPLVGSLCMLVGILLV